MKINIGVLGCANIAWKYFIPAILASGKFNLTHVASRTEEKAKEYASAFNCQYVVGYDNLLEIEALDAIYMPLPTGLHEEWVLKCIEKGKHIICEKSLSLNYASTLRMLDAARKHQCVMMEDFMFKYHKQQQFVLDAIQNNEIGELRLFRSSFGFPPLAPDNFRYNKELGGGALLDAGAYTIKAIQVMLGEKLELKSSHLYYASSTTIDLFGSAEIFEKNSGVVCQIGFGFDNFYQCNYEIWGSKGKITAHRAFTPPPDFSPTITLETKNGCKNIQIEPDNHFINILGEFYERINLKKYELNDELLIQSKIIDDIRSQTSL